MPDVGLFTVATHRLKTAVTQSGATVSDELRYTGGDNQDAYQRDEAWEARNKAFEAIAAYSDSLEAIVSSGNQCAKATS